MKNIEGINKELDAIRYQLNDLERDQRISDDMLTDMLKYKNDLIRQLEPKIQIFASWGATDCDGTYSEQSGEFNNFLDCALFLMWGYLFEEGSAGFEVRFEDVENEQGNPESLSAIGELSPIELCRFNTALRMLLDRFIDAGGNIE